MALTVAVLPFLAIVAATWLAATRVPDAVQMRPYLTLALLALATLSAWVAYASFWPKAADNNDRFVDSGHASIAVPILAILVFAGMASAALFLDPPSLVAFSRAIGPAGLVAIFFGLLSLMLSGIVLATRGTRIPGIALLVLVAVVLGWAGRTDNHAIRVSETSSVNQIQVLDLTKLQAWFDSRSDKAKFEGKPYPIFIVAAQGGGIYAAYHAAAVLSEIQGQWPEFSHHLFAISSVSGGSFGAAFHVTLMRALKGAQATDCNGQQLKARLLADRFFAKDFLSPLLFMALFPDIAQRFLLWDVAKFDRALGLEYAVEQAWDDLSRELTRECGWPADNAFVRGNAFANWLSELRWTAEGDVPMLFLNATHEESGRPIALSTVRKTLHVTSIWDMGFKGDLRLSTAAVLSARFPYITPFGWFEGEQLNWYAQPQKVRIYLGDGGYFDNSGAELLTNLTLILKNLAIRANIDTDVYAIVIGDAGFAAENFIISLRNLDNPQRTSPQVARTIRSQLQTFKVEAEPIGSTKILAETWAPIAALMGSREFRSKESVKSLLRVNGVHAWRYGERPEQIPAYTIYNARGLVFPLGSTTPDMPLGWLLSRYTRDRLGLRVGVANDCFGQNYADALLPVVNKLGEFMAKHGEDLAAAIDNNAANCSLSRLLELKPSG
ncbi:MAG: hypothetical protein ABI457_12885 [Hyphomicrobium sp.]